MNKQTPSCESRQKKPEAQQQSNSNDLTEGRGNAALEHELCRMHGRAGRMTSGGQRIRAQPGIRVEVFEAFARRTRFEHLEIPFGMHALEFLLRRGACLDVHKVVVETLRVKGIRDTRQSLRAFRMAIRDFMAVKYRVIEQRCRHVQSSAGNRSRE